MAEQSVPISRMVALKVIKAGMDTKQVLARFEGERQAVAMMDHPNIAKVLDAGATPTPTGRPYFAMELVKGIPITDFCDQAGLGTKERLALFSATSAPPSTTPTRRASSTATSSPPTSWSPSTATRLWSK